MQLMIRDAVNNFDNHDTVSELLFYEYKAVLDIFYAGDEEFIDDLSDQSTINQMLETSHNFILAACM